MTTKHKISEQQLLEAVARLREKTAIAEADASANTAGNVVGQALRTGANTVTAPIRAGVNTANWLGDKVSGAWDAAKQGVQNFGTGVKQGFTTGGIDPLHPIQSPQGAAQSFAQSGSQNNAGSQAQQAAKPKPQAGKPDPAVVKIQQDLIAKGAKIKADGIMGPATKAAQAQFAAAPAPAPTPAAPTGITAQGDDAGNTTITKPDGTTQVVGPDGNVIPPGGGRVVATNAASLKAAQDQAAGNNPSNATANTTQGPTNMGAPTSNGYVPPTQIAEGHVGYDEVQRLIGLVQYR